jgi:hypothetical protein
MEQAGITGSGNVSWTKFWSISVVMAADVRLRGPVREPRKPHFFPGIAGNERKSDVSRVLKTTAC